MRSAIIVVALCVAPAACDRIPGLGRSADAGASDAPAARLGPPSIDFGLEGMTLGTRTFSLPYGGAKYTDDGLVILLSGAPFDCSDMGNLFGTRAGAAATVRIPLPLGPDGTLYQGQTVALPYFTEATGPALDAGPMPNTLLGPVDGGTLTLDAFDLATATRITGTLRTPAADAGPPAVLGDSVQFVDGRFDVPVCPGGPQPTVKPEGAAAACATPDIQLTNKTRGTITVRAALTHATGTGLGDIALYDQPVTCADVDRPGLPAVRAVGMIGLPSLATTTLGKPQPGYVEVGSGEHASFVELDRVDVAGGTAAGCMYALYADGTKASGHFNATICPKPSLDNP